MFVVVLYPLVRVAAEPTLTRHALLRGRRCTDVAARRRTQPWVDTTVLTSSSSNRSSRCVCLLPWPHATCVTHPLLAARPTGRLDWRRVACPIRAGRDARLALGRLCS